MSRHSETDWEAHTGDPRRSDRQFDRQRVDHRLRSSSAAFASETFQQLADVDPQWRHLDQMNSHRQPGGMTGHLHQAHSCWGAHRWQQAVRGWFEGRFARQSSHENSVRRNPLPSVDWVAVRDPRNLPSDRARHWRSLPDWEVRPRCRRTRRADCLSSHPVAVEPRRDQDRTGHRPRRTDRTRVEEGSCRQVPSRQVRSAAEHLWRRRQPLALRPLRPSYRSPLADRRPLSGPCQPQSPAQTASR